MEARCHFGCLRHPGEITFRPRAAKAKRLGCPAIEIPLPLELWRVAQLGDRRSDRSECYRVQTVATSHLLARHFQSRFAKICEIPLVIALRRCWGPALTA